MRRFKKFMALMLAVIISSALLVPSTLTTQAVTFFDEGDFRFAVTGGSSVMVAGYYGSDTDITLPQTVNGTYVSGIYSRSFENSAITSVTIPRDYTEIGSFAFSGCTALTEVRLPSNLKAIGIMAFSGCTALEDIDFSIPQSLETIAFAAFSGCSSLESVEMPDSVVSLGENAFCNCSLLGELKLSGALEVIPEYAFYGCALTEIKFNEGVKRLGQYAFANNTALNSVDFPYSMTNIGEGCFENNAICGTVFLPEIIERLKSNFLAPSSGTVQVVCNKNTYVSEFCRGEGYIQLTAIDDAFGDVNCDGLLTIDDVTAIQKYLARMISFNYRQLKYAEADGDGLISINDATKLQRILAHIE